MLKIGTDSVVHQERLLRMDHPSSHTLSSSPPLLPCHFTFLPDKRISVISGQMLLSPAKSMLMDTRMACPKTHPCILWVLVWNLENPGLFLLVEHLPPSPRRPNPSQSQRPESGSFQTTTEWRDHRNHCLQRRIARTTRSSNSLQCRIRVEIRWRWHCRRIDRQQQRLTEAREDQRRCPLHSSEPHLNPSSIARRAERWEATLVTGLRKPAQSPSGLDLSSRMKG